MLDAVVEAADAGARGVLVVATGFSDTDEPEGREREEALLAAARARGVRLVGPNSVGLVNTDPAVDAARAARRRSTRAPGGLALSSQSGALGLALLGHAAARRLGVAAFVSLGNRADVSTNDLLEYWADDPRCTVIALYVESFGNPRRFSQVSRRVSRLKPILAVKGNRGAACAVDALSHTAAALGDEAAVDALLRQAGVLRVEGTEALFDAAELLERQPLPARAPRRHRDELGRPRADRERRVPTRRLELAVPAAATIAALAERAAAAPTASRTRSTSACARRCRTTSPRPAGCSTDDGVDAVIVVHAGPVGARAARGPGGARGGRSRAPGSRSSRASSAPTAGWPSASAGACRTTASPRRPSARSRSPPTAATGCRARSASARDFDDVDAEAAQAIAADALAGAARVARPRAHGRAARHARPAACSRPSRCDDGRGGRRRGGAVGGPVALKADAPPPAHAGDIDAVLLGLEGEAAVRAGWEELRRRVAPPAASGRARSSSRSSPRAPTCSWARSPTRTSGRSSASGWAAARPASRATSRSRSCRSPTSRSTTCSASPGCGRGSTARAAPPPLDRPALRDLVLRFARLLEHVPEIAEADLNPVRVTASGAHVLDARVRVAPRPEPRRAKTW